MELKFINTVYNPRDGVEVYNTVYNPRDGVEVYNTVYNQSLKRVIHIFICLKVEQIMFYYCYHICLKLIS